MEGSANDEAEASLPCVRRPGAGTPLTIYLDGDTVDGNMVSNGGGPGLLGTFLNFAVKDNTIGGNLIFSNNASVQDPDSNEVVTNQIHGNLICQGNSPAVQVGDSGGSPNTVLGHKSGQCAAPGL
jgi:hypothetical protein